MSDFKLVHTQDYHTTITKDFSLNVTIASEGVYASSSVLELLPGGNVFLNSSSGIFRTITFPSTSLPRVNSHGTETISKA